MNKMVYGILLASSSLLAMDTQWFVGLDASQAHINADVGFTGSATLNGVTYNSSSTSLSDNDTAIGIKTGAIVDKTHRLALNYTKYSLNKEGIDADLTNIIASYDYLFRSKNNFTPYVGAHIGQSKFEVIGFDDTGISYGAEAGILYSVTNHIEFEAGISYTTMNVKPTTPTVSGTYGNITLTNASTYLEANDMTKLYIGFNYKF